MNRLRHPVRAIEEPFGKAGLIVAVVALVLALTGAAFAATGLNGKQKKEVEKIAKKFAGKPGASGAPGAQGPVGTAGSNGKDGANGATGPAGKDGKSVTMSSLSPGEGGCLEGGVELELEGGGSEVICNGEEGPEGPKGTTGATGPKGPTGEQGQQGEPWSPDNALPSGATETGTWSVRGTNPAKDEIRIASISFPIQLSEPNSIEGHFIALGESPPSGCNGSVDQPEAEPGNLCIFEGETFAEAPGALVFLALFHPASESANGFGPGSAGAQLVFKTPEPSTPGEEAGAEGSWAVAAE